MHYQNHLIFFYQSCCFWNKNSDFRPKITKIPTFCSTNLKYTNYTKFREIFQQNHVLTTNTLIENWKLDVFKSIYDKHCKWTGMQIKRNLRQVPAECCRHKLPEKDQHAKQPPQLTKQKRFHFSAQSVVTKEVAAHVKCVQNIDKCAPGINYKFPLRSEFV